VLVKVVTDTMGFSESPQSYIKDIIKYAVEETWSYPSYMTEPTREVDFNHFVTVQFASIEKSNEDEQGLL